METGNTGRDNRVSRMEKEDMECGRYVRNNMDKNTVVELLRKEGFRITRQREALISIILEDNCTCCKEIYYLAQKKIQGIGMATIYRTIAALEKVGALQRGGVYQLCGQDEKTGERIRVELEDSSVVDLDWEDYRNVIEKGLAQCGYTARRPVKAVRCLTGV